jgi:simple sugar transport system ATP-binding protein
VGDDELVTAMVGEAVQPVRNVDARSGSRPVLTISGACLRAAGEGSGLQGVDLEVGEGEILGIAGVAGNGQRELADVITGCARPHAGFVEVDGVRPDPGEPRAFRAAGVVHVPADPLRELVVPGLTLAEHAALWEAAGRQRGWRFDVKGAGKRLEDLSGGNIQRVALTLALGNSAKVLVVSYPTRGLDVRTTEATRGLLLSARASGAAVVLISEDLDELMSLSDRIAVLAHGRISGVLDGESAGRSELGHLMTRSPVEVAS